MEKALPHIISLPKIYDPRGSLTFAQGGERGNIPFDIKRAYWIYDVPAGAERGGHSHKVSEELIIALSGSFRVNLYDGAEWRHYELNRPFNALYVPPQNWRTLDNFSTGAVCMVLTSTEFDESDYIRDYEDFKQSVK
ncbi:MAG: FdtA/QdtA family cupin domain-containing protein [Duncaniella sp.]|nr:FdtA/QdtA family cupin domain-containing protein [Duncaniella sp.]MDE6582400.1 FdtA/QdtA family cupin domain-containing protein [Duncaniella sp.]